MDDERVETGLGAIADGGPIQSFPETTDGLTTAGKDAAKALVALPAMTQQQLAALARELAMDIKTRDSVLAAYGLTNAQLDYLENNNEFFKHALKTLTIEWNSAASTPERIKLEAAACLEDAMPRLSARMVNAAEGLPGVTEVAKLFAKIAGVGERQEGQGAPGERFSITINLGGDEKLTVATKAIEGEGTRISQAPSLPTDTERQGSASAQPATVFAIPVGGGSGS